MKRKAKGIDVWRESEDADEFFKRLSIREYRKGHWRISGRWQGKRFFIQKGGDGSPITTYDDAYLWKVKIASEIRTGKFNPAEWRGKSPWRFDIAIAEWLKCNPVITEWKIVEKRIANKFLIPFFKQKDFRTIEDADISKFYGHLRQLTYTDRRKIAKSPPKHYSDKRIKDILNELKAFLLSQKHHFKRFPDFPKVRVQLPEIKWLNSQQQSQIFEFISKEDLPIFTFMRYTGCRPNEACGMLRQNVDKAKNQFVIATAMLKGGKLRMTTKTRIARPLPIVNELRSCFNYKTDSSKFVFTVQGRPYSRKMLGERWREANQKANKKYKTPIINLYNGLKHSWGMQRLAMGYTMDQVQAVMGHTTSRTTQRYATYLTENLADVLAGRRAPENLQMCSKLTNGNKKENWLGDEESNLDSRSQSPSSYH